MHRALLDVLICPYTKSPLTLEAFEYQGDEIELGVLHSEAGEYPLVAGIPIMFLGHTDLVKRLRTGRCQEAVALATIGPAPSVGVWRIPRWLQDTYHFRRFGEWLEGLQQAAWSRHIVDALFPPDGTRPSPQRLFKLAYKECRIPPAEAFNYHYYRYSMPRHLVALSFVQAMGHPQRPVLDLACGAGHITWIIQRRAFPQRTIGLDSFFFSLYVARTCIAPDGWFVCGDVNALPFRDATFSVAFCCDAFSYFRSKWSSLREMERVLDSSGMIMLVWLWNKLFWHVYGLPLTPQGYWRLVEHLPHRIIPDSLILQHYLKGYGPPAKVQADMEILEQSTSFSIWAVKEDMEFADQGPFDHWPHAEGMLGINPLYVLESSSTTGAFYVRRFPSDYYAKENSEMEGYLPERFHLSLDQQNALRQNCLNGLEEQIRNCVILGFPPRYLD